MLPIPFSNPTTYSGHSGVDFPKSAGTAIRASGPGRITGRRWQNDNAGYSTLIQYDNGPLVLYCHQPNLNAIPAVGSRVSEGTVIGAVGSTGRSTGPHLHMEIMVGTGAHTYDGVWKHFTRSRVVGSAPAVSQDVKNRQAWLNKSRGEKLTVDGILGSATTAAIKRYQAFLKVTVDGIWGAGTQAAHQRYYDAFNRPKLAVDGIWGAGTTKALQTALGVKADGIIGKATITALQKRVGVTADGILGPNTRKALQKRLGVTQDGKWGPATARALQTRLNAGTF